MEPNQAHFKCLKMGLIKKQRGIHKNNPFVTFKGYGKIRINIYYYFYKKK